ncbi:MAG: GH25 family lysozyme [Bacteroidota bacterium]
MVRLKKNRITIIVFLTAVFIFTGIGYIIYKKPFSNSGVYYKDFGIYLPEGYGIHGIDVSRYQRNINWKMVKEMKKNNVQIKFTFIKATQGDDKVDAYFFRNWIGSEENGIIRGAYHYFIPEMDAADQARIFYQTVQLLPGDLPPVLDIEKINDLSDNELKIKIKNWLNIIQQHYGVKPIIYTNADFYEDHLYGSFEDYPLWIAHYSGSKNPRVRRNWHFWQHNERGRVNGIRDFVDFNVFYGDSTAFEKLLID